MGPQTRYTPPDVRDVPLLWSGDVVVAGGGSAGSTAATAAARAGASTLLVESGGFLGGTGTRVLDTFYGFYAPGGETPRIVGGIGWEVCQRLYGEEMAFERPNTYGAGTGVTYEPEALKRVWDEVVAGSGARVLHYGLVSGVVMEGEQLVGLVVETRAGPRRVESSVVVDATGDAEVSWRSGATIDDGGGRPVQPGTATFRLGGVSEPSTTTARLHALIADAADSGDYVLPRREGSVHRTVRDGVRHTNLTRISDRDLTDPWELSWAEQEGRRQVWEYARFLRERVPGYEHSYLLNACTRLGVRETRRLVGLQVLDAHDFHESLSHADDIARCGAPIEDHAHGGSTRWAYVGGTSEPDGRTYGIPYPTLLPVRVRGLLVAGRCFSATHEAHASARSIGQCMGMGEAAGTAAALSAEAGHDPADLSPELLRIRLRGGGAILDADEVVVGRSLERAAR